MSRQPVKSWFRADLGYLPLRVALVSLALVSCGGGSGGEPTSTAETIEATETVGAANTSVESTGTPLPPIQPPGPAPRPGPPAPRVRTISFVPPGPTDPAVPTGVGDLLYNDLANGDCQKLRKDVASRDKQMQDKPKFLYRAAAEACLGNWHAAEQDFRRYLRAAEDRDGSSGGPCDGRAQVAAWVKMLLDLHRDDPGLTLKLVRQSSPVPGCPKEEKERDDEEAPNSSTSTTSP